MNIISFTLFYNSFFIIIYNNNNNNNNSEMIRVLHSTGTYIAAIQLIYYHRELEGEILYTTY